ncbi:MAG: carboxymuconolactone decarboxylase family protein [Gammaproteobacteria bacterium]|nr:carboxymuconolactone decarboxylase family protein [Gammaproteobacteria bacterium]
MVAALREGTPIPDMKLEALRRFTAKVVQSRGFVSEQDIEDFLAAGYGNEQILEVILGVGLKTLSNYTNHFADTPVDQAFQPQAWSKAS